LLGNGQRLKGQKQCTAEAGEWGWPIVTAGQKMLKDAGNVVSNVSWFK